MMHDNFEEEKQSKLVLLLVIADLPFLSVHDVSKHFTGGSRLTLSVGQRCFKTFYNSGVLRQPAVSQGAPADCSVCTFI